VSEVEALGVLAGGFGMFLMLKITVVLIAGFAFPVFWVWMLVDALLRPERDYPSGGSDEKLVWILFMLFAHVASVAYFFLVLRKVKRTAAPVAAQYTAA
jgi:hypothetical protein